MKKTIEIDDTLQDRVDGAIEEVKAELLRYLEANPDIGGTPCLNNDLNYSGAIHEIIDGSVPIFTHEIKDIFYLHGDEIEEAFDDSGMGPKEDKERPLGWKAAAIYSFIERQVSEWYCKNIEDIFGEFKAKKVHEKCCGLKKENL